MNKVYGTCKFSVTNNNNLLLLLTFSQKKNSFCFCCRVRTKCDCTNELALEARKKSLVVLVHSAVIQFVGRGDSKKDDCWWFYNIYLYFNNVYTSEK